MTRQPAMGSAPLSPAQRRERAVQGLAALGMHRDYGLLLRVRCHAGHHVAAVYDTPNGRVVATLTGPHSHGSRDFADVPHKAARRGREHADLLDEIPGEDRDPLPSWCECGNHALSQAALRHCIAARQKKLILT